MQVRKGGRNPSASVIELPSTELPGLTRKQATASCVDETAVLPFMQRTAPIRQANPPDSTSVTSTYRPSGDVAGSGSYSNREYERLLSAMRRTSSPCFITDRFR